MSGNSKDIQELIDKIRGKTEEGKTRDTVDAILKAEKEIADERAKVKAEKDKSLLDKIKAEEEKLKNQKEGEADDADGTPPKEPERDSEGKFKKKEPDTPGENEEEGEDDAEEIIKKLTGQMEKIAEEVEALKKRKNYRTKPPKAKQTDAKDLPDFIVQNTQNIQNKDYEVMC